MEWDRVPGDGLGLGSNWMLESLGTELDTDGYRGNQLYRGWVTNT